MASHLQSCQFNVLCGPSFGVEVQDYFIFFSPEKFVSFKIQLIIFVINF